MHEILVALVAESIEGDFILPNDDIVLLEEASFADLVKTRCSRPVQVSGGASDAILASVYRADEPVEVIDTALKTRKFLNFDSKGWPAVAPFLNSLFPAQSNHGIINSWWKDGLGWEKVGCHKLISFDGGN